MRLCGKQGVITGVKELGIIRVHFMWMAEQEPEVDCFETVPPKVLLRQPSQRGKEREEALRLNR